MKVKMTSDSGYIFEHSIVGHIFEAKKHGSGIQINAHDLVKVAGKKWLRTTGTYAFLRGEFEIVKTNPIVTFFKRLFKIGA